MNVYVRASCMLLISLLEELSVSSACKQSLKYLQHLVIYLFIHLLLLSFLYITWTVSGFMLDNLCPKKCMNVGICKELILPLGSSQLSFPLVTLLHSLHACLKEGKFKHSLTHWSHLINEHEAWYTIRNIHLRKSSSYLVCHSHASKKWRPQEDAPPFNLPVCIMDTQSVYSCHVTISVCGHMDTKTTKSASWLFLSQKIGQRHPGAEFVVGAPLLEKTWCP